MPSLISCTGYSIDFETINAKTIPGIPEDLRPAAKLIFDWLSGKETFEIQTSGSTGKPQTILLERDKIEYSALQTANSFGLMPGDTLLCCLGLHYIAGFMMVMRTVVCDCNLVIASQGANPLADVADHLKIDFASFVPLQMETMLNDPNAVKTMNKMKAILIGGAPVSDVLQEKLQILTVPVFHTYSMTETYTHVAFRQLNGTTIQKSYHPMRGVNISLDDRGCIVINSVLTDNKPLITNDIGEIMPDGSFNLLGRVDNVINSGGIKIQLEKIEKACGQVFASLDMSPVFFAAGIKDEKLGEKLILVIEGEEWGPEMINNFSDQLSIRLGKYELPKEILFVDEIILTRTGKIDRKKTLELL